MTTGRLSLLFNKDTVLWLGVLHILKLNDALWCNAGIYNFYQ